MYSDALEYGKSTAARQVGQPARGLPESDVQKIDSPPAGVSVSILQGCILLDGRSIKLPRRQLEVITLLALERHTLHSEEILAEIWPDSDPEKAATHLRVTVNRLRKWPELREAIITTPRFGYTLQSSVRVDLFEIEALEATAHGHHGTFDDRFERSLWEAFTKLVARESRRKLKWEWFARSEQRIAELVKRIARLLLERRPLLPENATKLLILGRRLVNDDQYDEFGRELIVLAYLAQGDDASARLEIREYECFLSRSEGLNGPSELRHLLNAKR